MTIGDILLGIPVYPESVKLDINNLKKISSDVMLCEDDYGNVSFMDDKSKTEALKGKTFSDRKVAVTVWGTREWNAFGEVKPLMRWAKDYGLKYTTLRRRIFLYGMSLEKALTYKYQKGDK